MSLVPGKHFTSNLYPLFLGQEKHMRIDQMLLLILSIISKMKIISYSDAIYVIKLVKHEPPHLSQVMIHQLLLLLGKLPQYPLFSRKSAPIPTVSLNLKEFLLCKRKWQSHIIKMFHAHLCNFCIFNVQQTLCMVNKSLTVVTSHTSL